MISPESLTAAYKELADWNERQGQLDLRDRFLVLAADAALHAGQSGEAEGLRGRLLRLNPHHLLRPFASFAEALASPDVQSFVGELRWKYPPGTAESLLEQARSGEVRRPAKPTRAVPPTVPVLDLDEPPLLPEEPAREAPRLYRVRKDEEEPAPAPRPGSAPRKTVPAAPLRVTGYDVAPLADAPAPRRSEPEADDVPAGAWLSTALFVVTLAAGLALLAYSVAGPFLPAVSPPARRASEG